MSTTSPILLLSRSTTTRPSQPRAVSMLGVGMLVSFLVGRSSVDCEHHVSPCRACLTGARPSKPPRSNLLISCTERQLRFWFLLRWLRRLVGSRCYAYYTDIWKMPFRGGCGL